MTPPRVRKITPHILARWLNVHPKTVLRWVHAGTLPALDISTGAVARFVIYRKDAVALLRKRGWDHRQLVDLGLEGEPTNGHGAKIVP